MIFIQIIYYYITYSFLIDSTTTTFFHESKLCNNLTSCKNVSLQILISSHPGNEWTESTLQFRTYVYWLPMFWPRRRPGTHGTHFVSMSGPRDRRQIDFVHRSRTCSAKLSTPSPPPPPHHGPTYESANRVSKMPC